MRDDMNTGNTPSSGTTGDRSASPAADAKPTRTISRRSLVRTAGIALPTIATLHSGAALAQSSNLLSTVRDLNAEQGKFNCLDTRSVYPTKNPNVYDLGDDPMAHVTRIRSDKKYYAPKSDGSPSSSPATPKGMCKTGGDYLRKDPSGYKLVKVRRGGLVSATALSSFSNDVTYTDI